MLKYNSLKTELIKGGANLSILSSETLSLIYDYFNCSKILYQIIKGEYIKIYNF